MTDASTGPSPLDYAQGRTRRPRWIVASGVLAIVLIVSVVLTLAYAFAYSIKYMY